MDSWIYVYLLSLVSIIHFDYFLHFLLLLFLVLFLLPTNSVYFDTRSHYVALVSPLFYKDLAKIEPLVTLSVLGYKHEPPMLFCFI